jgi:hypothetical protein
VADHRGDAREHADEVAAEPEPQHRRDRALGDVEERDREAHLEAERAPDVRRARVAAAERPDVHAAQHEGEPVPPRHAAEDVAGGDEEYVGYE